MDTGKNYKIWEAKKQTLFLRAQSTYDLIRSLDQEASKKLFIARLRTIEETKTEFHKAVDKYNEYRLLTLGDECVPDYQALNAFDDLYGAIMDAADSLKASDTKISNDPCKSKVKLLPLELVEFTGEDLSDWPIFYHSFKTSVHDNPNLSDSDRIKFILSKLKKKALLAASGIQPRAENYSIIWNSLVDKYEDKRTLANTYLKQIVEFKYFSVDSEYNLDLFTQKFIGPARALQDLGLPDLSGFILLHLALNKLAPETVRQFEAEVKGTDIPSLDQLFSFISSHGKMLSRCTNAKSKPSTSGNTSSFKTPPHRSLLVSDSTSVTPKRDEKSCPICCKQVHQVYLCPEFKSRSPFERYKLVKEKRLCFNCLSFLHTSSSCKSAKRCSLCAAKHHTSIHFKNPAVDTTHRSDASQPPPHTSFSEPVQSVSATCSNSQTSTVLLSTATVNVLDHHGNPHRVRVLLDSASQSNFLTADCCRKLKLPKVKVFSSVQGIGKSSQPIRFFNHAYFYF